MKLLRTAIVWLTLLALVLTLSACGPESGPTTTPTTNPTTTPTTVPTEPPLTAADVYASLSTAMKDAEPTRMKMDFEFILSYTQGQGDAAVKNQMSYAMKVDSILSMEPFGNYSLVSIGMEADGMDMNMDVEVYAVVEEDEVVTYTKAFGMWTRLSTGMTVAEFQKSDESAEISTDTVWSGSENPTELTLEEKTHPLNGRQAHVLHCKLPLEDMEKAFEEAGLDVAERLDISTIPVTYYVDSETWQILRMEMDTEFLEQVMGAAMAESLLGAETEGLDFSVELSCFAYELGYGAQNVPAIPQEAYDYLDGNGGASGDLTEPEVSGPPILVCNTERYLVTVPEGWDGENMTEDNVWLYNEEFTLIIQYLYDGVSSKEEVLTILDDTEAYLKSENALVSREDGPAIEGYETAQIWGKEEAYYYAWREVDGGWLLMEVCDFRTELSSDMLGMAAGLLSPVTE